MTDFVFSEATREQIKARIALDGVSGSGKTFTAILVASLLVGEVGPEMTRKVAVIDSERGSSRRYAKGRPFHFSVVELTSFEPENYIAAIRAAERQGFEVVVIDSASHEWMGTGGALEQVDKGAVKGNSYVAWGKVTPRHNAFLDAIMKSPIHVIATMRSKMAYEQGVDANGKKTVTKLGLQPMQREGVEYEFDIAASMDLDNLLTVTKTRCSALRGKTFLRPGREFVSILRTWLDDGEPTPAATDSPPAREPERRAERQEEARPAPSPRPSEAAAAQSANAPDPWGITPPEPTDFPSACQRARNEAIAARRLRDVEAWRAAWAWLSAWCDEHQVNAALRDQALVENKRIAVEATAELDRPAAPAKAPPREANYLAADTPADAVIAHLRAAESHADLGHRAAESSRVKLTREERDRINAAIAETRKTFEGAAA